MFDKKIGGVNIRGSISDVRTLYPNGALSDTIIDLYVRYNNNINCVSEVGGFLLK